MPNALAVVIAQLEDVERQLLGQLETTRNGLTALRAFTGDPWPNVEIGAAVSTPEPPRSIPFVRDTKRSTTPGRPGPKGAGDVIKPKILAALERGSMSPGDLADKLKVERSRLRHYVAQLEADGAVIATGVTTGRRIALPAKEAP